MADVTVRVVDREEASSRRDLAAFLDAMARADPEPPLSEHKRVELFGAGRHELAGLVASGPDGTLVGYAQLCAGHDGWGLEVVTLPDRRGGEERLLRQLLSAALVVAVERGGGPVRFWRRSPAPSVGDVTAELGARPERELLQMRVTLPLTASARAGAAPVAVRAFVPGRDEQTWLEVNNRAFADHPEQGGWDLAMLTAREAEPWFDPSGFLLLEDGGQLEDGGLLEDGGQLVGFCWTKVHRDTEPPMGEIYAIAVDPSCHGRGLGRALTVAGLDWLHGAGLTTGMLYVDASNAAAVRLYRSLGFVVHHADRSYVFDERRHPPAPDAG